MDSFHSGQPCARVTIDPISMSTKKRFAIFPVSWVGINGVGVGLTLVLVPVETEEGVDCVEVGGWVEVTVEVGVTLEVEDEGGTYFDVDVGVGVGVGDGEGAEPKTQEPVSTPVDSDPKNSKRLGVRSSPPGPQPGHCKNINITPDGEMNSSIPCLLSSLERTSHQR